MSFAHLHLHTEYSFLDGVPTLPALVSRVKELGQEAVAMTDHGEVSGHLKFQEECEKGGIKPIFGLEAYFVDDASVKLKGYDYDHMTLLATNNKGLENLWALSSRAFIEGMYYKPRIDYNMLRDHAEGIIATGGCLGGCVASYYNKDNKDYNPDKAVERMSRFVDILGDRFYFELHTFPGDGQAEVNQTLVTTANTFGVPMIAVSDCHYLRPDDWQFHELLIAAQMNKKHDDPTRYQYGPGALYVMSEDTVRSKLEEHLPKNVVAEAIDNTGLIADQCDARIESHLSFPVYFNEQSEDEKELVKLAWENLDDRIKRENLDDETYQEYRDRLEYEIDLVISKGFAGYFLIVADVISWSKKNGILIGPGRGSVGGSLLAFALGITELDPIRWGLLFERFLDPSITALPDIDVDIPQLKREQVREYLRSKYHIATIGTLNTLAPKLLLRDFARVLNISSADADAIVEVIDSTPDLVALSLAWDDVREIKADDLAKWKREYPKLFALMDMFGSHYRHAGANSAGMVISKEPLMGKLPLRIKDKDVRTQFVKEDVEQQGYVKIDFLGLRTLSTLENALEMAQKGWTPESGKPEPKHYYDWQYEWDKYYEDKEVFESLQTGRYKGIFQLEGSDEIAALAKAYKPVNMEDMCGVISLYRPGITRAIDPETNLNLMDMYIQRRDGKLPVKFRHEMLEPILKNTYGNFLYQEQVMAACREMGGFSPPEQTKIRKVLGKKMGRVELSKQKALFLARCAENGIDKQISAMVWGDMENFGVYGFNRSHGFAYGIIAYWTAWMKHHYPGEYMAALFQTDKQDLKGIYRESRRLRVEVLGPDMNESESDFAWVNGKIRYGLQGVKYVGGTSDIIQNNRPYSSVNDCLRKLTGTKVTKTALEPLILVGAMDNIVAEEDRINLPPDWSNTKVALWNLYRSRLKLKKAERELPPYELFMLYNQEFEKYARVLSVDDREANEIKYLGDTVTVPPFGQWVQLIKQASTFPGLDKMVVQESCLLGGIIKDVLPTTTKRGKNPGQRMCRVWVDHPVFEGDEIVDIESDAIVVFPQVYTKFSKKLKVDAPVVARVTKLKDRDGKKGGLMLQHLIRLDEEL